MSDKAKARWNTVCIPSAFNAVRREKILFKTGVSLICTPKSFGALALLCGVKPRGVQTSGSKGIFAREFRGNAEDLERVIDGDLTVSVDVADLKRFGS